MAVTTKDIAEACDVSRGTVDRALNDRPGINDKTKQKVLEVAKEMGYRPHYIARSLVKGRTMTLGLVVFDLHNRFFAQLVDAIETYARSLNYFVYLTLTEIDQNIEKDCLNHLVDRRVDGVIMCPVNGGWEYEEYLNKLEIPIVTMGNRLSDKFTHVGINDKQAMKDAVSYIIKKNYNDLIYFSPPLIYLGKTNVYAPEQRYLGFREAVQEADEDISSFTIEQKNFTGILDKMKFTAEDKTAILCSSDSYALKVLNYLKDREIKVPEEVGLMGFDNIDVLDYVEPSLATVAYPIKEMGQTAVDCLLQEIEDDEKEPQQIRLEHEIIEGESL